MGLRDALNAGRNEIRLTAEEMIASLNIEEQLKQAVVLGQTLLSIPFKQSENMLVIQQEVVRQITEDGFVVEWETPCCPNARMEKCRSKDSKLPIKTIYWYCHSCDSNRYGDHKYPYGHITIKGD